MTPRCIGCNKRPAQIPEYAEAARAMNIGAAEYVRREEGTMNRVNEHFLCTECYITAGMPSAPGGWVAP